MTEPSSPYAATTHAGFDGDADARRLAHAALVGPLHRLAAHVAHDFSNVLTIINGYGELLAEPGEDPSVELRGIQASVLRGSELLGELRRFARDEPPVTEPVVVASVVQTVIAGVGGPVQIEDVDASVAVAAPAHRVAEAVRALVDNAFDASPAGPVVLRAGTALGGHVAVHVVDRGEGMAPDVARRAHEPFFSTRRDRRGLGLTVAYAVAAHHGGWIELETAPGAGTSVALVLPAFGSAAKMVGVVRP